jgi:hypothetical protein
MIDYGSKSDHDINIAVTYLANNLEGWSLSESNTSFYHCGIDGSEWVDFDVIDYCNRWTDMGPIIFNNGICVTPDLSKPDEWIADKSVEFHGRVTTIANTRSTKPLRAAAIVFLKMKGVE